MNEKNYWKELFIIVLIKSFILGGLWCVFFKDKKIVINTQVLEQHLMR